MVEHATNIQPRWTPPMHGFWDYTTPGCGGMEGFVQADYEMLLDDMSEAGMNTLEICIKWLTTGYRSRLSYIDQLPGNPIIESDNELLRWVIDQANARGIGVWINIVVTMFEIKSYGLSPYRIMPEFPDYVFPNPIGFYDLDQPGVGERALEIINEIVDLFPGTAGLTIEIEEAGVETPHRIPLYNNWAEANQRPQFETLGHPFHPRYFDVPHWRDYTTYRRIQLLEQVELMLRGRGYTGGLSMLCESGRTRYAAFQEVNTEMFHQRLPNWSAVTYEYEKWDMRDAMTFFKGWPMPITLEENWRRDLEDMQRYRPDGVLWFGCGAARSGTHVHLDKLRQSCYEDGHAARRALLKLIRSELK